MFIEKQNGSYFLFLRKSKEEIKETLVYKDKLVEVYKGRDEKEIVYYRLNLLSKAKILMNNPVYIILEYDKIKKKSEILFNDTRNWITLTRNSFDNKTYYVFGEGDSEADC